MISFLYFDVGGVVIKDFSATNKWQEMQRDLGVTAANQQAFDELWQSHRDQICISIDVDSLLPEFRKIPGLKIQDNYLTLADFVNRFERNESIWPVIQQVRQSCRIGLLTNMYPRMFSAIKARGLLPPVEWDIIIDSSVNKSQKPELKIFEIAQITAGVTAEEILFIDNSQEHVQVAASLGWNTFFYDSKDYEKSSHLLAGVLSNILR